MYEYEKKRNRRLYETVSITKLISILFCGIIFFSVYGDRIGSFFTSNDPIYPITLCFVAIAILALIYKAWTISNENKDLVGLNTRTIVEVIVYIVVFFSLILISGGYESQYKMIFIFIIATSTIEFGKK